MTRRSIAAVGSLAVCAGCTAAASAPDAASVEAAVDSMLVEHAQHLIGEDLDAAMTLYSEDPSIRPNHAEPQHGRDAIRQFMSGWFAGLNFRELAYDNEEVAVFGDTAVVIGTVTATVEPEGGSPMTDRGSYMVLLVRDSEGHWRSHRGVFNSSLPLPVSPPQP
jgi:uncharacterized protein (TIGR02246 family)